jgi:hypothetical protein
VATVSEGERARGADGKFVAKPADAPQATTPAAQPTQPGTLPVTQEQPIPAPAHWKGNGKVDWARLPRHVQKALSDDFTQFSQPSAELTRLKSTVGEERLQQLAADYGSVEQGFQSLVTLREMANKNPLGFIQWYAQQRGIDLRQLVQGAQQGEMPAGDQNPLVQEVLQLRNQVQQFFQQQQTQAQTQVLTEIDAFAKDTAHPYFNDVREHMGALMKAGKAANLQEAYDMATWAVPSVRQSLLEQTTQQAMQANAQKVQAARTAAGSLTGSPAGASVAMDQPDTDLESMIRKQVNALP